MSGFNRSQVSVIITSLIISLGGIDAMAANGKTIRINKVDLPAPATASLDQQLRLKKIFLFPSLDDVSGVLTPELDNELAAAVKNYTRFDLVRDREIIRALKADGEAYNKVGRSDSVHREAITAANADGSILLSSETTGGNLQLTLELREKSGQVILSETEKIPAFSSEEARTKRIASMFASLVKKIPYLGTVTGRSGKTVTIDLGRGDIKVGDELDIAKLISEQRHPLLKTLVSADYTRVGVARVTNVDRVLSFADITEEMPGEVIATNNKVVQIRSGDERKVIAVEPEANDQKRDEEERYTIKRGGEDIVPHLEGEFDRATPQFGFITADLGYGTITHEHALNSTNVNASGSGFGAVIGGELWLTRNWAAGGTVSLQGASLDVSGATSTSLGNASWNKYEIYGGYRLIPGKADDLSILFGAGYSSSKVNLPSNSAAGTGQRSYSGLLFKVDGDILLFPKNKIGVGLEIVPFSGFDESGTGFGSADSASDVGLHLEWLHEMLPNLWGKIGFKLELANASAMGGGTDSEKRFIFGPGVLYYF